MVCINQNKTYIDIGLFCVQYKITNMQRCPYIHEMKERLLGEQIPMEPIPPKKIPTPPPFMMDQQQLIQQQPVATIVKVNYLIYK